MKMLAAAVALAALVASPAFAQSYDPDIGTGNIAPPSDDPAYVAAPQGDFGAFARVPEGGHTVHSHRASQGIYDLQGHFYGTDPDPNIRWQLNRESEQGEW
jgi:hypothetical protein